MRRVRLCGVLHSRRIEAPEDHREVAEGLAELEAKAKAQLCANRPLKEPRTAAPDRPRDRARLRHVHGR